MPIWQNLVERAFNKTFEKRLQLAVAARDDGRDIAYNTATHPRDRRGYDRRTALVEALEAWRVNPLARRIVSLTTQYVVGGGISVESPHAATNEFLQRFWEHRLNHMATRGYELCDELTRSGDLFLTLSTDAAGMSYLRPIPAVEIHNIETADNDREQEKTVVETARFGEGLLEGRRWEVYDADNDTPDEDGRFAAVMLHYAINRPVGALWGESDLAPLLRWLARYANWLEDRARLNRYRNVFMFWVRARFSGEADKMRRQAELNNRPPAPGSILVTDESEDWRVLNPQLNAGEAGEDGLAIKKMIASGAALPLHFLAEPESATRTTAEAAGGPTFRHYEQRQLFFRWMLEDLLRAVVRRRALVDPRVDGEAPLRVRLADISARDNAALATAATTVIAAFGALRDRGLIDDHELLRLAYRFAGEIVDLDELLRRGAKAPIPAGEVQTTRPRRAQQPVPGVRVKPVEINPISGDVVGQQANQ